MKNFTRLTLLPVLAFGFFACEKQETNINDADLQIAAKMIGETLADEREGLLSTMYDATGKPGDGRLQFSSFAAKGVSGDDASVMAHPGGQGMGMGGHNGRGGERNVTIVYDSVTGVHTVSFERSVTMPEFTKTASFVHKYIYKDAEGNFVQFPRRQGYASVEFEGTSQGSASGGGRSGSHNRTGKFTLTGMEEAATSLDYDGEFNGTGTHSFTSDTLNASRSMTFKYVLANISIAKNALQLEQPLAEGVTGTITYEVKISKTVNGETEEELLEGTIELTGDGTALLEYLGRETSFLLNLKNGETRRHRR